LSFSRAGEELHVSQAAISQQVKLLEERLGVRLFQRRNNGLALSEAGRRYFQQVTDALDRLATATEELVDSGRTQTLTLTTIQSFAALWLVSRAHRFRQLYPEISLRVFATDDVVDLRRERIDVAIRHGRGGWSGLHAELVLPEGEVFPVCSPRFLEGRRPLRQPADLRFHSLIHDNVPPRPGYWRWVDWLAAAEVTDIDASRGAEYSHTPLVIQAAIAGEGVALLRAPFARAELAAGRLVRPFELSLKSELGFYFVCLPERRKEPTIRALADWLRSEAAA
jgi:LysR family transcriptional regulator, glycine cleavage system transcriptional activator